MNANDFRDAHFLSQRSLYQILQENIVRDYIQTLKNILTPNQLQ